MVKCTICRKEFPEDISYLDLLTHVSKEHKKELEITKKEIIGNEWDNIINNNKEYSKKIVKELYSLKKRFKLNV